MGKNLRKIPINFRLGIRMAMLIVGICITLMFAALAFNSKIFREVQLAIYKRTARNTGRSVALLVEQEPMVSFIERVREIYEAAPPELRDVPDDPDAMYQYSIEDGAYEALFESVKTPEYYRILHSLEDMAEEIGVIDINIYFIDFKRHRKVNVMYAVGDERFQSYYADPGYWAETYDFVEEYAKNGDPDAKGFYTDYMIENNQVRALEAMVPFYDPDTRETIAFIAVEQRWKVMDDARVDYIKSFFLSMGPFAIALLILSECVLQFAIIRPLNKLTANQTRMATELDLASSLQLSMLPVKTAKELGAVHFDIHAQLAPAREVGGDFYDYFIVDDDHVAVVIADVVGKGVPASIFAMAAKTTIKMSTLDGHSPKEIFDQANQMLCDNNNGAMFSTAWLGIYSVSEGKMVYANAGHNDPLILRADSGRYEYMANKPDMVLGILDGAEYTEHTLFLSPGDKLFLYTDGVVESQKPENERLGHAKKTAVELFGQAPELGLDMVLFGEERLLASLNADVSRKGTAVLDAIFSDVREFVGDEPQFDDITMVVFEVEKGEE